MMTRAEALDRCDAALCDKPRLAAVFDAAWRAELRSVALAEPQDPAFGFPMAYWWPMLDVLNPGGSFPPDIQRRIETGLDVLLPKMASRDRGEMTKRLRLGEPAACDELMATAAFAAEFERDAVKWPGGGPHERKPEFFVEPSQSRWAVECRHLRDNLETRIRNAEMVQSGHPWTAWARPEQDANRMRTAIIEKIKRAQGSGPTFIILISYTPWLLPVEMQAVICQILCQPEAVGLAASQLPIGVACLSWYVVQGVWFCEPACTSASIDGPMRERVRRAIVRGFVPRTDLALLTEVNWASPPQ
jgi:hypothetical protein